MKKIVKNKKMLLISLFLIIFIVSISFSIKIFSNYKKNKVYEEINKALVTYLTNNYENSNIEKVSLQTLKDEGLIKDNLINPATNKVFDYNDYYLLANAKTVDDSSADCSGQVKIEVINSWDLSKFDTSNVIYICPKKTSTDGNLSSENDECKYSTNNDLAERIIENAKYASSCSQSGTRSTFKEDISKLYWKIGDEGKLLDDRGEQPARYLIKTQDLGIDADTYFYRGDVIDNYVTFENMCWRIVRTVENYSLGLGDYQTGVKLILQDDTEPCNVRTGLKKLPAEYMDGSEISKLSSSFINGKSCGLTEKCNIGDVILSPIVRYPTTSGAKKYKEDKGFFYGYFIAGYGANNEQVQDVLSSWATEKINSSIVCEYRPPSWAVGHSEQLLSGNSGSFPPSINGYNDASYQSNCKKDSSANIGSYVGLITADEVIMAGGRLNGAFISSNTKNGAPVNFYEIKDYNEKNDYANRNFDESFNYYLMIPGLKIDWWTSTRVTEDDVKNKKDQYPSVFPQDSSNDCTNNECYYVVSNMVVEGSTNYGEGSQHLITSDSGEYTYTYLKANFATKYAAIRPVIILYNAKVSSGDGTLANPYIASGYLGTF